MTGISEHSDFPRVKKLALVFAGNAKGKLELAFFVKNLNSVVKGVGHYDLLVGSHAKSMRRMKLPFCFS
jgi:hypothetical protein